MQTIKIQIDDVLYSSLTKGSNIENIKQEIVKYLQKKSKISLDTLFEKDNMRQNQNITFIGEADNLIGNDWQQDYYNE
jgi:hypothetical protein